MTAQSSHLAFYSQFKWHQPTFHPNLSLIHQQTLPLPLRDLLDSQMTLLRNDPPLWLESLLDERFFLPCTNHGRKEMNMFCLDCCSSYCSLCVVHRHRLHRLLQIRRYMYQDVIRVEDLEGLVDCESIQSYVTNGAKVVFVHERQQSRPIRSSSGNMCIACRRALQDPYHFCSLSCKVNHNNNNNNNNNGACELEGQLTPVSVLESPTTTVGLYSTTGWLKVVVRRKRSSCGVLPVDGSTWCCVESTRSRKARPCRSPLC